MKTKTAPIIGALADISMVKGIVCFGSYALGTFDQYSDIDLYVFCDPAIIPSAVRQNILQKIEGISDLQMDHAEFGWDNQWCPQGDRFRLKGVFFDITFNTVDWIRTVVRKVAGEGATSIPEMRFRPYTMLGLVANSIILYDPKAIVSEIKSNLYPYPHKLKNALIEQSLSTMKGSLEDLCDYVKRGIGNSAFRFQFQRIIDSLGTLLFALNEKYDPATKRVEEEYSKLKVLPYKFLRRYKTLLEAPLTVGGRRMVLRELRVLVDEIELLTKKADKSYESGEVLLRTSA